MSKNRVQFLVGSRWQLLGDYESEERAIEVAQKFIITNPGSRSRVVSIDKHLGISDRSDPSTSQTRQIPQDEINVLCAQGINFIAQVWFGTGKTYRNVFTSDSLQDTEKRAREYTSDSRGVRVVTEDGRIVTIYK